MPPQPAELALPLSSHQTAALAAARNAARATNHSETATTEEDAAVAEEDSKPKDRPPRRDRHLLVRDSFANQDTIRAEERKQRIGE